MPTPYECPKCRYRMHLTGYDPNTKTKARKYGHAVYRCGKCDYQMREDLLEAEIAQKGSNES